MTNATYYVTSCFSGVFYAIDTTIYTC